MSENRSRRKPPAIWAIVYAGGGPMHGHRPAYRFKSKFEAQSFIAKSPFWCGYEPVKIMRAGND